MKEFRINDNPDDKPIVCKNTYYFPRFNIKYLPEDSQSESSYDKQGFKKQQYNDDYMGDDEDDGYE